MLGRSTGAMLSGIDAHLVEVEVDVAGGLPSITAVGLPDAAVRQGIDRVRSALGHAGYKFPPGRITINLAPANVRKQGAALDLPIAAALLIAGERLQPFARHRPVLAGELALDGGLRAVAGALCIALAAREAGRSCLLVPSANAEEAGLVAGLTVVPIDTLADLAAFGQGLRPARPHGDPSCALRARRAQAGELDLSDVRGQSSARRALEIAAAGGHHLLLTGPPGTGKTMLASRLPGILPPLELDEALAITRVWSAAGLCHGLVIQRPFRAPHHGISLAGLTGGGLHMRPGEMSLASHGVLFLDEITEFRRDGLEALRQPLEEGRIRVVRVHSAADFPAAFTLVASMNPCPCGHRGRAGGTCSCTPSQIQRYRGRLSGPLVDRFDLVVEVPPVDLRLLADGAVGEASAAVRRRVVEARRHQRHRFGPAGPTANAGMKPVDLARHAAIGPEARRLLITACERLGFSARGFDRVRRVARTVADLAGAEAIGTEHVAEALQYRQIEPLGG